jgi:hypothetical protein
MGWDGTSSDGGNSQGIGHDPRCEQEAGTDSTIWRWMDAVLGRGDLGGCVGCWPTIAAVVCSTVGRARRRDDEEASEEVKSCV